MATQFPSEYIRGTDNGKPTNIYCKDAIICRQWIQLGPGMKRIACNKPMNIIRLFDAGTIGPVPCNSLCLEYITPKTRYVAICRNFRGHFDGKPNIICKECVEKYQQMKVYNTRKYDVIQNYYR